MANESDELPPLPPPVIEAVPELTKLTGLSAAQLSVCSRLTIVSKNLKQFPREILRLTQLAYLDLHNNSIGTLPPEFVTLEGLTVLDLGSNQLGVLNKLPREIFGLPNLLSLDLRRNAISFLPREIGQLSRLEVLNLKGNLLTKLPPEIGRLHRLKNLDLGHNALESLPLEIGQLSMLNAMSLRDNKLQSLPNTFGSLFRLSVLDLGHNSARLVSEFVSLYRLQQVSKLCLSYVPLVTLPAGLFQFTRLEELDLSNCQLTALPDQIGRLTKLVSLDLTDNPHIGPLPPSIGSLSNLVNAKLCCSALPPEILLISDPQSCTIDLNGENIDTSAYELAVHLLEAINVELPNLNDEETRKRSERLAACAEKADVLSELVDYAVTRDMSFFLDNPYLSDYLDDRWFGKNTSSDKWPAWHAAYQDDELLGSVATSNVFRCLYAFAFNRTEGVPVMVRFLLHFAAYVVFLGLLSNVVMVYSSNASGQTFYFADGLAADFVRADLPAVPGVRPFDGAFLGIRTADMFWRWMQGPLYSGLFEHATSSANATGGNATQPIGLNATTTSDGMTTGGVSFATGTTGFDGAPFSTTGTVGVSDTARHQPLLSIDNAVRLLGSLPLRQVRTKSGSCTTAPQFASALKGQGCSVVFSRETEDRGDFGSEPEYVYKPMLSESSGLTGPSGITYPLNSGYVAYLDPANRSAFNATILRLQSSNWIDRQTAAVFVEPVFYNANLDLMSSVEFVVELPPSGAVLPSARFTSFRLYSFALDASIVICVVLVGVSIVWDLIQVVAYCRLGWRQFVLVWVLDFWNLLNVAIYGLSFALVVVHLVSLETVSNLNYDFANNTLKPCSDCPTFQSLAAQRTTEAGVLSALFVVAWLLLGRFLRVFEPFGVLLTVLARLFWTFMRFVAVYLLFTVGCAGALSVLLASSDRAYQSWGRSIFTLIGAFVGDFPWRQLSDINPFAAVLLGAYVVFVLALLMNFLIALLAVSWSGLLADASREWANQRAKVIASYRPPLKTNAVGDMDIPMKNIRTDGAAGNGEQLDQQEGGVSALSGLGRRGGKARGFHPVPRVRIHDHKVPFSEKVQARPNKLELRNRRTKLAQVQADAARSATSGEASQMVQVLMEHLEAKFGTLETKFDQRFARLDVKISALQSYVAAPAAAAKANGLQSLQSQPSLSLESQPSLLSQSSQSLQHLQQQPPAPAAVEQPMSPVPAPPPPDTPPSRPMPPSPMRSSVSSLPEIRRAPPHLKPIGSVVRQDSLSALHGLLGDLSPKPMLPALEPPPSPTGGPGGDDAPAPADDGLAASSPDAPAEFQSSSRSLLMESMN